MEKGVIVWKGDLGRPDNNYAKSVIEGVTDDTALGVLATALSTHTSCNIAKRSFNTVTAVTDVSPGVGANVDRKAIVYMKNPANLHVVKIEIPDPPASDCESIPGSQGERLTAAALSDIVVAINAATGMGYVAMHGKVIQRA